MFSRPAEMSAYTHFWNFRKKPICYPKRICVVDKIEDSLLCSAKEFGLPVVESYSNNNQMEKLDRGTIYIVDEFEDNPLLKLFKAPSDIWILGPTFLAELTADKSLQLRDQPTYCTSMFGLYFHVNCPGNIPLMERMVQLIKWMGGLFVLSPNLRTTHMISTSALAKGCTYCWTFKVPILTPQWVEYCWQQRDVVGFKAVHHSENYILPGFAALHLCFVGFDLKTTNEMKQLTKEYGGNAVSILDPKCTHMVFSDDYIIDENIAASTKNIYIVTSEWFWSSLKMRHRNLESDYQKGLLIIPLSESYINMDVMDLSSEHCDAGIPQTCSRLSSKEFIEDSLILKRKDTKKKFNFEELLRTEKNYIMCLHTLVDVKHAALDEYQSGGPILNKAEANSIFGNIEQILQIHQELAKQMEANLIEWDNDTKKSMRAIIKSQYDMLKEYKIYATSVEDYQRAYELCERKNCRFKNLITSNKLHKENLKDLFIRPIQRLGSILLLLTEMKKQAIENTNEKAIIKDAMDVIKVTLDSMDENKAKSDNMKVLFNIFYNMENCPPDIITSHREFIVQFSAKEITTKNNFCSGETLVFFLFNDIIVTAKLKNSQSSKTYKHLVTLPLCMIEKILLFEAENESNMFGFVIRNLTDDIKTTTCCFQYIKEGKCELDEVLLLVAKQISFRSCSKSADEYIVKGIPAGCLSFQPINNSTKKESPLTPVVKNFKRKLFNLMNADTKQRNKTFKRRSVSCSELDVL